MSVQKVALITAGSAGLGACIARTLAKEAHMRVVINYSHNVERAEALLKDLKHMTRDSPTSDDGNNSRFLAIKADVGDKTEVKRLVEEVHAVMGRLDVVVSNAGWTKMRNFLDLEDGIEEDDWDRCFKMNVKSHLWLFHAARSYLDVSEGAFITTASVAGVKPSGSSLPYAVTKAAQIHLIRSLAIIAAPKIRVNAVAPGVLLTEWGLSFPEEKLRAVKEQNRLKRFATVEDVALQVLIFALSRSITGQVAVIDAGFSS
ncbi:Nn.00g029900.m01.CDS01 [Neocucurbitaria sp. VM-36]